MALNNVSLEMLLKGLKSVESSNRYNAVGPMTRSGDRAYGISQVMGQNVGPWSQQYYGQKLTPSEYLKNEKAQDAVTRGKLGELLNKYGNAEDTISTWFSGKPLAQAGNASDGYKTVPEYVNKVLGASGAPNNHMAMAFSGPQQPNASPAPFPGSPNGFPQEQPPQQQPPLQSQTINLGDQGEATAPLNNIGSTMANVGAAIASLDRHGNGVASLNASNVANNLAAQERAREKDVGWKYAGQTQNGQGMIFQNQRGEIRVEPLSGQFAGNKNDETSLQKDFAWAQNDPEKMKLVNASHGVKQDDALDPEDSKFWADYVINDPKALAQVPKNLRPQVMHDLRGLAEKAGLGGKDLYQTVLSNAGNLADEKRRSQLESTIDSFKGDFLAGAKQVVDYSKALPRGFDQKPLESAYQWAEENSGTPEAEKINALKVSLEGMERGYVRALSASNVGGVEAEKKARQLFDPAQKHSVLMAGVKAATQDVLKYNQFVKDAHENKRAKNAGKPLPHPELEDEDAAIKKLFGIGESSTTQSTGLPSVGKKTTINGVEIERLE